MGAGAGKPKPTGMATASSHPDRAERARLAAMLAKTNRGGTALRLKEHLRTGGCPFVYQVQQLPAGTNKKVRATELTKIFAELASEDPKRFPVLPRMLHAGEDTDSDENDKWRPIKRRKRATSVSLQAKDDGDEEVPDEGDGDGEGGKLSPAATAILQELTAAATLEAGATRKWVVSLFLEHTCSLPSGAFLHPASSTLASCRLPLRTASYTPYALRF